MRTAEEIVDTKCGTTSYLDRDSVIKAINEARKEAIEECAERAQIKYFLRDDNEVSKESILSLIKELK